MFVKYIMGKINTYSIETDRTDKLLTIDPIITITLVILIMIIIYCLNN